MRSMLRKPRQNLKPFCKDTAGSKTRYQACLDLGGCLLQMIRREEAFSAYVRSFLYAPPSARLCNALGFWCLHDRRDEEAEYSFRQSLHCTRRGGFEHLAVISGSMSYSINGEIAP